MQYQIKDLEADSKKVNIVVKLIKKFEPKYAKGFKITNFLAADPTGSIVIPFWNDDCNAVNVGDFIEIQNGYVSYFNKKMQLNVGKYGSYRRVEPPEDFDVSVELPKEMEEVEAAITPITNLQSQSRNLFLRVFVKKVVEEKTVRTRWDGKEHRVVSFLVGDESGCIILDLWDEAADVVKRGMTVEIRGAYVRTYHRKRFLSISRKGSMIPCEREVSINCTNNLSEKSVSN